MTTFFNGSHYAQRMCEVVKDTCVVNLVSELGSKVGMPAAGKYMIKMEQNLKENPDGCYILKKKQLKNNMQHKKTALY